METTNGTNHDDEIARRLRDLDQARSQLSDAKSSHEASKARAAALATKETEIKVEIQRCERDWSGDDSSWETFAPPLQKALMQTQVLRRKADDAADAGKREVDEALALVTECERALSGAKTEAARAEIARVVRRNAELIAEVAQNLTELDPHVAAAGSDYFGARYAQAESVRKVLAEQQVSPATIFGWLGA